MKFCYGRISDKEKQNLALQTQAFAKEPDVDQVFLEKESSVKERPVLDDLLARLRPGDTLVVWKLDRLGRSLKQLIVLMEQFDRAGIKFKSLTEQLDTSSAMGRLFFHIVAAFAQMERELILERTRAGLDAANALGRFGGRPRKMTASKINSAKKLLASGEPMPDVAKNLGVSLATLYRHLPATQDETAEL
jgi:DNA invertase Pin-like site-specific DNA recombinase